MLHVPKHEQGAEKQPLWTGEGTDRKIGTRREYAHNIAGMIRTRRVRWAGPVARVGHARNYSD